MAKRAMALFQPLNVAMFRWSGGRMKVQGRPLVLLETVGARSGKRRHTTLGSFPDEDPARRAWLVVGSNLGAASHPAWCVNLARRPDEASIEMGREKIPVRAESLHGADRERAWGRVVTLAPGYAKYEHDTDREIPIVRLVPRSP